MIFISSLSFDSNFVLDSSVRLAIDGEIQVEPESPLFKAEKDHLIENFFNHYLYHFKTTLRAFRLFESHEYLEMKTNPDFMKARAFIHFSRSLKRFCKKRYDRTIRIGLTKRGGYIKGAITKEELNFISKNKSSRSKEDPKKIDLYGKLIPANKNSLSDYIKENPEITPNLCKLIGLKRLEMLWAPFAKDVIKKMALDSQRLKKNKGIPQKTAIKNIKREDKEEYLESLRKERNESLPVFIGKEEVGEIENSLDILLESPKLSRKAKKYLYLTKVMEVDTMTINLEFGQDVLKIQEELKRIKVSI